MTVTYEVAQRPDGSYGVKRSADSPIIGNFDTRAEAQAGVDVVTYELEFWGAPGGLASADAATPKSAAFWRPISQAPFDGTPVWGFLHETGIRLLRWMSPAECAAYEGNTDVDEYDGCWVEATDADEEWSPALWAPLDAIPLPNGASERLHAAIAKARGHE